MNELEQACHDLAAWFPRITILLTQPDIIASAGHTKPHSTPPWNSAAANALFDALEGTRRIHSAMQREITGRDHPPQPHSRAGRTLQAIPRLALAVSETTRSDATRQLTRYTTTFLQLPAVDLEERPQRINAACPYCRRPMLRLYPRDGRLTCLAYGDCFDADGRHPIGHMTIGQASGEPFIAWADGTIQLPEGLAS